LINYYSSVDCEKVILVHGDNSAKLALSQELESAISKNDKTSKVVCGYKDYFINI
jgi:hypothetical protein